MEDRSAFLAAVQRSRALHRPWVYPPTTSKAFRDYVKRSVSGAHRGFLVLRNDSNELVGVINLGHIIYGKLCSAYTGYYAFADGLGEGLMREAMCLVLSRAFGKLKLHRLEANIQPANRASIRFARSCGFVREGFSRRYLKVGGKWRDHERWAILADDWRRRDGSRPVRSKRPRVLPTGSNRIAKPG